jgi:hypothetical protein
MDINQILAIVGLAFASYIGGALTGPTVWKRISKAWFG